MINTKQQDKVKFYKGKALVVKAGAGTGKTSTLVEYALENPKLRMLFLAYNKPIRDDAAKKFPRNVECRTTHSLAFAKYGRELSTKLSPNIRLTAIKNLCNCSWTEVQIVKAIFEKFLCSKDSEILDSHVPESCLKVRAKQMCIYAKMVWDECTDLTSSFPATHDVYLKQYHLSKPNLGAKYDVILFDECQDANDLQADVVLSQDCTKIFVGDDHQQIYRWRYANNAMKKLIDGGADVMYLTKSFRFGNDIADIANHILNYKHVTVASELMVLEGNESIPIFEEDEYKPQRTILHRTVYGTIETAIKARAKVHWVGGINSYNITDLLDVYHLSNGEKHLIRNKQKLAEYKTYEDYIEIADLTQDVEMRRAIRIINEYSDIDTLVGNLNFSSVDADNADIIITTAHRSKGLEWDHIEISEDFSDVTGEREVKKDGTLVKSDEDIADELNLMYVAVTRAKRTVKLSNAVHNVISESKRM